MLSAYSAGRLLPTRTMVLDRREKYTRTEYAKVYDAGGIKCIKLVLDAIRDWANVYYLIIKTLYGEVLINNT